MRSTAVRRRRALGPTVHARASRSSPTPTPVGPGRPSRRAPRRRRVHGPPGRSFWEDVLPGEVGTGPLEDFHLHLQCPVAAAQLGELLAFAAGQPVVAAAGVQVVLLEPTPQAR